MNCERYLDLISARLDGEVTVQEEAELTAHLQECPACRAIAQQMQGLHSALDCVGEVDAPAALAQNVMAQIKKEKRHSRRRLAHQLASLAACLVLCVTAWYAALPNPNEPDPQMLSEAWRTAPQPSALTRTEPDHYVFSNDQYLRVTYGSTPAAPAARIIGSAQSLSDFLAQFPENDLSALTEAYPEAFFRTGRLLTVLVEESSGSNRHKLQEQGLLADSVTVIRQIPEVGTCDMAAWLILAEVDDSFSDGDLLAVSFTN